MESFNRRIISRKLHTDLQFKLLCSDKLLCTYWLYYKVNDLIVQYLVGEKSEMIIYF